ncbi:hypothetical protein ACWDRB_23405 [Nonomuraea sp. NPDC003707]
MVDADADADADPPWPATACIPGPSLAEAVTGQGPLPPAAVRVLGADLVVYRVVHEEPDLVPLLRACLAKTPADRPRLNDVLDRLEGPDTVTHWLPPDVTVMITERGTAIRTPARRP